MAVANAIGSNVFNVLFGLGLPWFFFIATHGAAPIVVDASGLLENALTMLAVGVLYMAVFFGHGLTMTTRLGWAFIALYGLYVLMVVARFAKEPPDPFCV